MRKPTKPQVLGSPPRNAGLPERLWWAVGVPFGVVGGLLSYVFYLPNLAVWKVLSRVAPDVWEHPRLNGSQAERFLDRLKWVKVEEWQTIKESEKSVRAAYGWYSWDRIALAGLMALGGKGADQLSKAVEERIPAEIRRDSRHSATIAALSIALAGELTEAQVTAGYAPFAESIPIAQLGPGLASAIAPPPATPWGRFVCRLRAIEGPEQQQVIGVAYAIERAVGVDEIDRALTLQDMAEPEAFIEAAREIEEFTNKGTERLADVYQSMGRFVGNSEWASAHVNRATVEGDVFVLCALRALGAVMSYDRMPAREFAILYAPLAGLVPVASLQDS